MADSAGFTQSSDEVERLAEAAEEFWDDDEWAISQTLWTDGDSNAYAFKRRGRDEQGRIREERLYVVAGEIRGERTLKEDRLVESKDPGVISDR